jgi:hypothetical protein
MAWEIGVPKRKQEHKLEARAQSDGNAVTLYVSSLHTHYYALNHMRMPVDLTCTAIVHHVALSLATSTAFLSVYTLVAPLFLLSCHYSNKLYTASQTLSASACTLSTVPLLTVHALHPSYNCSYTTGNRTCTVRHSSSDCCAA